MIVCNRTPSILSAGHTENTLCSQNTDFVESHCIKHRGGPSQGRNEKHNNLKRIVDEIGNFTALNTSR